MTHISKEFGVDLDIDVSLPKIKGNFKGSHEPVFDSRNAKVIPISEEDSVEDLFRSLAQKKSAVNHTHVDETDEVVESDRTILSGYMEKDGRSMFSTWNKRCN